MDFDIHPYRDMESITNIPSVALEHKNSMGNGIATYMSAGICARPNEINPPNNEAVHLQPIWVQPDRQGVPSPTFPTPS